MKLEVKFGAGYKHVSFDPSGEKPEIVLEGYGLNPAITDETILEKFEFFFKNVNFSFWYTESWQDWQGTQTQFSLECLENFDRCDLNRLSSFVDRLLLIKEESLLLRFFVNQDSRCFAMQGCEIVGVLCPSNYFIEKQDKNSFVFAKKQNYLEKQYFGGAFTEVFEALL